MNDALGLPQSVLVLGGGSEIARATVRRLVKARATTVIVGGRPGSPAVDQAVAEAKEGGAATTTVSFDAMDPASVVAAVEEAFDAHGDIDLVLLTFGVLSGSPVEVATVNYTAAVAAGSAAAARLAAQGHGTIVALSSVAGERVRKANYLYGSSKAGMDGFFQGLADELHGTGVRVLIVRPGFVRTRMTAGMPEAPLATDADAVARTIVSGLAAGRAVVWAPPALRWVFVLFRHLPRQIWRRIPD